MDATKPHPRTDAPTLTVTDVCERYRVNRNKVGDWIARGDLHAIDISAKPGIGLPRWRVSPAALADFERRRSSAQRIKSTTTPRRTRAAVPDLLGVGGCR